MEHEDRHELDTAAILAGGLGTRLRPALADAPKVLARVLDRPFITLLLEQLAQAGIRKVVLLTGYRASDVRRALGDSYAGLRLIYSVEPAPMGTGGAVRRALSELQAETFLLLNGDSYCEVDFRGLAGAHRRRDAELTLTLARVSDTGRFGQVKLAEDNRVVQFAEKTSGGPGWINAGVYVMARSLLEDIPPDRACSLERDLLPRWATTRRLYSFKAGDRFLDIGTPSAFAGAAVFFSPIHRSFNPEPTATADVTPGATSAVAAGSGLNELREVRHAPA